MGDETSCKETHERPRCDPNGASKQAETKARLHGGLRRHEQLSERKTRYCESETSPEGQSRNPARRAEPNRRHARSGESLNLYANLPESKRKTFVIGLFNLMKVEEGLNEPCTSTNG